MRIKQLKNNLLLSVLLLLLLSSGCGLFFADDPEDPQGNKIVDPFSFKEILRYNIDQFDFEDYDVLFQESFIYEDPYEIEYLKVRLLSRLGNIESEYIGDSEEDTIIVKWSLADTTSVDPYFDKEKVIILQPRRYHILVGDSPLTIDTSYIGEATFNIIFDKLMERWIISYWKDVPTDGAEKSFFHPDF